MADARFARSVRPLISTIAAIDQVNVFHRSRARKVLAQALYQCLVADEFDVLAAARTLAGNSSRLDNEYLQQLCQLLQDNFTRYQQLIVSESERDWSGLDPMCQAILLLGTCELLDRLDVPGRVSMNEAIKLSKTYGSSDEVYKYTNAVLDKIARKFRGAEMAKQDY